MSEIDAWSGAGSRISSWTGTSEAPADSSTAAWLSPAASWGMYVYKVVRNINFNSDAY